MRARRIDANQPEIVNAFRALGCSVWPVNDLVDLIVGYGGICICVEVKDGKKPPSARALTEREQKFKENWRGGLRIVDSLEAVKETVELLRKWHFAVSAAALVPR